MKEDCLVVETLNKNQLRNRAVGLQEITDEIWESLDIKSSNKKVIEKFLKQGCRHLSPKTVKQYKSALRIFAKFIMENLDNRALYKIKRGSFLEYQNWLLDNGLSSSAIKLKRAAVSSLFNYCETYLSEEDDDWEKFRNCVLVVPPPSKTKTYDKIPITESEFEILKKTLLEKNRYRDYAIVVTLMKTGMRIGELRQLKKNEAEKIIPSNKKFIKTGKLRGKGRGVDGKPVEYLLTNDVIEAMKLWLEHRGEDDNPYMFTSKRNNTINQISENYFSNVCLEVISPILNRRINAHLFRGSAATNLLSKGANMSLVKEILQHEDMSTTAKHYDLRDVTEMMEDELNDIL